MTRPAAIAALTVPAQGIRSGDVVLRLPSVEDMDALLPPFGDLETRDAGNLPAFSRDELAGSLRDLPSLAESGRLLPLAAIDAQ